MGARPIPSVSLVLLTYDRPRYVRAALESVRAQTYPAVEIVITDDGSTNPEMLTLLDEFEAEGLTVVRNKHEGLSASTHHGMSATTGTYAMIMGDDDLLEPEYLEEAVAVAEADTAVGIVYCHADLIGAVSGPWDLPDYHLGGILLSNQIFATFLFRRSDWTATGGYDLSMRHGRQDHDFILKLLTLGRKPARLDGLYFHYRRHAGPSVNQSSNVSREVQAANYAKIFRNNIQLYEENAELFWTEIFAHFDQKNDLRHRYAAFERLRVNHPRAIGSLKSLRDAARGVLASRRRTGREQ